MRDPDFETADTMRIIRMRISDLEWEISKTRVITRAIEKVNKAKDAEERDDALAALAALKGREKEYQERYDAQWQSLGMLEDEDDGDRFTMDDAEDDVLGSY